MGLGATCHLCRGWIVRGKSAPEKIHSARPSVYSADIPIGTCLAIAKGKSRWGEWGRWLKEHNLKRTTAWEAIQLYERAGSEEAIANLTPSQAKRRFGIGTPPRADTEESAESENHNGVTPQKEKGQPPKTPRRRRRIGM